MAADKPDDVMGEIDRLETAAGDDIGRVRVNSAASTSGAYHELARIAREQRAIYLSAEASAKRNGEEREALRERAEKAEADRNLARANRNSLAGEIARLREALEHYTSGEYHGCCPACPSQGGGKEGA